MISRKQIEYVIFDMDGKYLKRYRTLIATNASQGLMIDSEGVYTQVTSNSPKDSLRSTSNRNSIDDILAPFGKVMTWEMKAGCMGRRMSLPFLLPQSSVIQVTYLAEREAAEHLLSYFPDIDLSVEAYLTKRNIAQDLAWPKVQLLPGVKKLVQHLKKHTISMAVATSSRRAKYELKTGHHQDVFGAFGERVVCGDDASVKKGKPAPDVFLVATRQLLGSKVGEGAVDECSDDEKVMRGKGLVFEDAIPGVQAGKRAGMSGTSHSIYHTCN